MANDPQDQQEDSPAPEGGAFDQSDIDALLAGAADDASALDDLPSSPDEQDSQAADPAPSDEEPVDQAAIDALLAGEPEQPAPPASEAAPANEVSQADIDALLGGGEPAEPSAADESASEAEAAEEPRLDSMGKPFDEFAAAMQAAMDDEKGDDAPPAAATPDQPLPPPPAGSRAFEPVDLGESTTPSVEPHRVSMLNDVDLKVRIELGRTRMLVEDVLELGEGSVVELDKLAGDPVEVFVNDRLIASGEVLILNDNFCVRISEVLSNDPHRVAT